MTRTERSRSTLPLLAATACLGGHAFAAPEEAARKGATPIQHVIVIMQENRSFDNYFGTFPGANGIPGGVCVPLDPSQKQKGCVVPFHDPHDVNSGGPHGSDYAQIDADDGIKTNLMDGFILSQTKGQAAICKGTAAVPPSTHGRCAKYFPGSERHDVMGYHTDAELPNYWAYAKNFVLQDELFESVRGWSLASHLYLASEWAAKCSKPSDVATCVTDPSGVPPKGTTVLYPWVNLFQLLDLHGVSWKYYLATGTEPDCEDDQMTCDPQVQNTGVLSLWNPAPGFASVEQQGAAYLKAHNPPLDQFLLDIKNGTLPQVSWIVPSDEFSEHPAYTLTAGQEYVTSLVNAVMQSPYWANTAIFISWDDWGGFYDHVVPPVVDMNPTVTPVQGWGFRVPGLLISAYAKPGLIDHSVLSLDSYATLIEDLFLGSTRLDPAALGQPDSRPDIRDNLKHVVFPDGTKAPIGNLINEFDFKQKPLPPLILSTHIPTGIAITCGSTDPNNPQICGIPQVTITWKPVTGPQVPGIYQYQVLRDGFALGSCITTKSTCFDKTPPSGVHYYVVYSIDPKGVSSPVSAAAEADTP